MVGLEMVLSTVGLTLSSSNAAWLFLFQAARWPAVWKLTLHGEMVTWMGEGIPVLVAAVEAEEFVLTGAVWER